MAMLDPGAADRADQRMSALVQEVVDGATASGDPALQEAADRLAATWRQSLADREAAPTMGFGRAANDLAQECTDRGFTYPAIGW